MSNNTNKENTTQPKLSAVQIASSFVTQYYTTLAKEPEILYKFYKEESHFAHGFGETLEPVQGIKNIQEKIKTLDFQECKAKLSTVDSQDSLNGSIFIVVQGYLSNKGSEQRPFVQSFILAQQEKGYFVLNDIFRYLSDETSKQETKEKSEEKTSEHEEQDSDQLSNVATAGTAYSTTSVEDRLPIISDKEPSSKRTSPPHSSDENDEKDLDIEPEKQPVKTSKKAIVENDIAPKSYASVVGGKRSVPVEQKEKKQEEKPKKQKKKKKQTFVPKTEEKVEEEKQEQQQEKEGEKKRKLGRSYPHAIYVSRIPDGIEKETLINAFKQFGAIVDVSTHKKENENYAFVYYETADGVEQAVKSNKPVIVGGVELNVEKRRPQIRKNQKWFRRGGSRGNKGNRDERQRRDGKGGYKKTFYKRQRPYEINKKEQQTKPQTKE